MATTDSTELAVIKPGGYVALNHPPNELLEPFVVNLGGDTLSKFDLDKASVPSAGGTRWRVVQADGATDDPATITGVIVGMSNARSYYESEYTGGGEAPLCSSFDGGLTGVGNPGGTCHDCPMNQFGTARNNGAGKACAEGKHLLLLTEDEVLPMLVTIPAVSLKAFRGYMSKLSGNRLAYYEVVTEFAIGTTKTGQRSDVVCAKASRVGVLNDEAKLAVATYRDALDGLLNAAGPRDAAGISNASQARSAEADAEEV